MRSRLTLIVIRGLDLILASLMLLAFSPLLVTSAIIVRLSLGSPVLFRQVRAGVGNRPFEIMKFRSMHNPPDPDRLPGTDRDRLTPVGRFLRKSSLDELPELFNVLRGDMSLVGPRPLFLEYYDYYSDDEKRRLTVRPGLTGLAQISGRNFVGWDRKLELDVRYVDNLSVWLYLKVLSLTVVRVFNWKDVSDDPLAQERRLDEVRRSDA